MGVATGGHIPGGRVAASHRETEKRPSGVKERVDGGRRAGQADRSGSTASWRTSPPAIDRLPYPRAVRPRLLYGAAPAFLY
jgi:hypothetical protein